MPKKSDAEMLAELLGIEPPTKPPEEEVSDSPEFIAREAEAVLGYMTKSMRGFVRDTCGECGKKFAHTGGAVGNCSNPCRAAALAKLGIRWDYFGMTPKPDRETRFYPLVVPASALTLVDEVGTLRDELKCPVYNHMRDAPEHNTWCWADSGVPVPAGITLVPYTREYMERLTPEQVAKGSEYRKSFLPTPTAEPETVADDPRLDILKELGLE
jgi:hypothetical protein